MREGDYKLAFGDIFGGNAFLPVLFLLAVLVSGKAVLPNAHASDVYLTALGRQCCIGRSLGMTERDGGDDRLSDGHRELVEGCADPVAGGDVGGEFIVAAAEVLKRTRARRR